MMSKIAGLAAAFLAAGLVPAVAQTPTEAIAELARLFNSTGKAEVAREVIYRVFVNVDQPCRFDWQIDVAPDDASPPVLFTLAGAFADIDASSLRMEFGEVPILEFSMIEGRDGMLVSGIVASDHPHFERMKEQIARSPDSGTCSPTECKINDVERIIKLPVLTGVDEDDEARVVGSFKTLIALCAEE